MSDFSRREFLKRTVASGIAGGIVMTGTRTLAASGTSKQMGSFIDLTKCDGCRNIGTPACVSACQVKNRDSFPEPVEKIENYWPHKKTEDWSKKRDIVSRLTPYNWTFVQNVDVEHDGKSYSVSVPRRCMHCDNPPCAKICPFGVNQKTEEGAVVIDPDGCFGGAKCRDVCPWGIPQRQAGVGLYLKFAPKYLGGGVMYKCDMCIDRLKSGENPACAAACPNNAITFGPKSDMLQLAKEKAQQINGFIYGEKENGGTSTFYVSAVPFEKIHQALMAAESKPGMAVKTENFLDTANGMALGLLVAPVAATFAAGFTAFKTMKGGK